MNKDVFFALQEQGKIVVGVDIGQTKVGVAILSDGVRSFSWQGTNDFVSRYDMAKAVVIVAGRPDLVVIEDYAMMPKSYVAFGMGEFGGIVRTMFYELGTPFILCPPNLMRSFCGVSPRTKSVVGKKMIGEWAKEYCGFVSIAPRKVDRENERDAFAHAVIGQCYLNFKCIRDKLSEKEQSIILKLQRRGLVCQKERPVG